MPARNRVERAAPHTPPPEGLAGREYYRPTGYGAERRFSEVLERIKGVLRGQEARDGRRRPPKTP